MSSGEVLTSSLDLILLISDVGIMVPRVGINIKFFKYFELSIGEFFSFLNANKPRESMFDKICDSGDLLSP